jgi:hypothetical protein
MEVRKHDQNSCDVDRKFSITEIWANDDIFQTQNARQQQIQ